MPWKTNASLPPMVREALPAAAQTVWRGAANAALADGEDEASAAKIAWSAVKRGWRKNDTGDWVKVEKNSAAVDFQVQPIQKLDEEERLVIGWASVISKGGEPLVDRQGDVISAEELERAFIDYALTARVGKRMHEGEKTADFVFGLPLTKRYQDMLGVEMPMEGFFGVWKVHCPETWEAVRDGRLAAFSIGGSAMREEIADA